jgi:hypothetical protein
MKKDYLNNSVNNRGYLLTVLIALIIIALLWEGGKQGWFR